MSQIINTVNPYNGETLDSYKQFSNEMVENYLSRAHQTFQNWRSTDIKERTDLFKQLAENLLKNKESYSTLMTQEMGKPISQSRAEIEKCALLTDFYVTNVVEFLADEKALLAMTLWVAY